MALEERAPGGCTAAERLELGESTAVGDGYIVPLHLGQPARSMVKALGGRGARRRNIAPNTGPAGHGLGVKKSNRDLMEGPRFLASQIVHYIVHYTALHSALHQKVGPHFL